MSPRSSSSPRYMRARREVAIPSTSLRVTIPERPSIEVGAYYELQDERIEVLKIEGLHCVVRLVAAHVQKVYPLAFVERNVAASPEWVDLQKVTAKKWKRAKTIKALVVTVIHERITSRKKLDALGKKLGLGWRQVQRYCARYRAMPGVASCVGYPKGREKGKAIISFQLTQLMKATCKDEIENKKVETDLDTIHGALLKKCAAASIKPPSKSTLWRQLRAMGYSLRKRRQLGPAKYKESITIVEGTHRTKFSGAEFQIDHTLADVMITDESRTICLGRPWLTLVIDTYSGSVCGFYFSFRPPSIISVARALSMAVADKTPFLQRLGLSELYWPMMGIPLELLTDQAKEFQADDFLRACDEHSIRSRLRLVKHYGGKIERRIGHMMGKLHLLAGTTFSNVPRRIKYDPEADATYTGNELTRRLVTHICEFHETPDRDGITPYQHWEIGRALIPAGSGALRPAMMPKFYKDFLPIVESKRRRDGIHWGDCRYKVGSVRSIPVGHTVRYQVDHTDNSTIGLILPSGEIVQIGRIDAVTYTNYELESQLCAARRYQTQVGPIAARRNLAKQKGREVDDEAKAAKAAARAAAFVLPTATSTPLTALPPPPSESAPSSSPHVGVYVPPTRILLPRKLR